MMGSQGFEAFIWFCQEFYTPSESCQNYSCMLAGAFFSRYPSEKKLYILQKQGRVRRIKLLPKEGKPEYKDTVVLGYLALNNIPDMGADLNTGQKSLLFDEPKC